MSSSASMPLSAAEQERGRALARMKWLATGLFLLMAFVFGLTFIPEHPPRWLPFLRAFCEAAMVGALADWFAVTALFRHPLGIPIPHTAIVPNNKDQIGTSLAGFVERNFLTPQVLAPKLEDVNFADKLGRWMDDAAHARRLSKDAAALLVWLLGSVDNDAVRQFLEKNLRSGASKIQITPLLSKLFTLLTSQNRHQELMDSAVAIAKRQLYEHQFAIRGRVDERSPWWIPGFVDEEIYRKIVLELARLLDRIGDDPHHAARQSFNQATEDLIYSMAHDPEVIARGEALKHEITSHPAVQKYLTDAWDDIKDYVSVQSRDPDSTLRNRLQQAIRRFGRALQEDGQMQQQINGWVCAGLLYLVNNYRESMASIISDTVKSWDTALTTRRVELQVGRDLQFIRINGTLVGGLVGLLIYSLVQAF
ncbi:MAG: DUF445 domain-containing protein [Gammaproteobacteria bacterium]|nr:DUF445 domain-containing protein [Gammaproteobacteria bacterium]